MPSCRSAASLLQLSVISVLTLSWSQVPRQQAEHVSGDGKAIDQATLWTALQRTTGLEDADLRRVAQELMDLKPPSQRGTWIKHVQCGTENCAGEAVARLLATLGEGNRLPLRGFEPFPGDPLYDLWRGADRDDFQSWVDGADVPQDSPLSSLVPEGQPLAIGRIQAAEFLLKARARIVELTGLTGDGFPGILGRCLEWDEPFYVVKGFGNLCRHFDVLQYANPDVGQNPERRVYRMGTRVLVADVLKLPPWFPRDYGIIVCFFVLEHVPDPLTALRSIARMLLPGGFLLLGAPFIDGVHACPDDFFRFTPRGLQHITEVAGLDIIFSFSPGSPAVAAGDLLGLKSSYWRGSDLLGEADTHPVNVFLLARKRGRQHRLGPPYPNLSSTLQL